MHAVFQRFVDRIMARPDVTLLGDALAEALTVLDIQSFAYLLVPVGQSAARLISNYPTAWTAHYLASRYETIDPVVLEAGKVPRSFVWGPGADLRSDSHVEFFAEAARFGIRCGLTIPIHDGRADRVAMTFAADTLQPTFIRAVERYDAALQLIATLFHRAARRMLVPELLVDDVALSPREYECLAWSAKGKTASEIGIILGISRRTVVDYLERAKQKLGVYSIAEAVARFAAAATRF